MKSGATSSQALRRARIAANSEKYSLTDCIYLTLLGPTPLEGNIEGNRRAVGIRRLWVHAHLIEYQQPRTERKALLQIMSHHEHGHFVHVPQLEDERVHIRSNARIQRAKGF